MAGLGLLARYPFFSAYIVAVLAESLMLFMFQPATSKRYWVAYWISEFVTAVLSFGIAWEGYNEALARYPGVRRMARSLLGLLFAVLGAKVVVASWGNPMHNLPAAIGEFERDLRLLLALSLLALVGLVVQYAIPLGRNALFLLIGFGFYLGVRVATLNCLFEGPAASARWLSLTLQSAWNIAALIWIVGMWSYVPAGALDPPLEIDYDRASRQTIQAFDELRHHLVDSWRS
ncbi:MAG TPA: hypothetical protein VH640_05755 [Bryobacteraceae bacterium]|jgi:hypothetical protein